MWLILTLSSFFVLCVLGSFKPLWAGEAAMLQRQDPPPVPTVPASEDPAVPAPEARDRETTTDFLASSGKDPLAAPTSGKEETPQALGGRGIGSVSVVKNAEGKITGYYLLDENERPLGIFIDVRDRTPNLESTVDENGVVTTVFIDHRTGDKIVIIVRPDGTGSIQYLDRDDRPRTPGPIQTFPPTRIV